jgi:hypothetical protein
MPTGATAVSPVKPSTTNSPSHALYLHPAHPQKHAHSAYASACELSTVGNAALRTTFGNMKTQCNRQRSQFRGHGQTIDNRQECKKRCQAGTDSARHGQTQMMTVDSQHTAPTARSQWPSPGDCPRALQASRDPRCGRRSHHWRPGPLRHRPRPHYHRWRPAAPSGGPAPPCRWETPGGSRSAHAQHTPTVTRKTQRQGRGDRFSMHDSLAGMANNGHPGTYIGSADHSSVHQDAPATMGLGGQSSQGCLTGLSLRDAGACTGPGKRRTAITREPW